MQLVGHDGVGMRIQQGPDQGAATATVADETAECPDAGEIRPLPVDQECPAEKAEHQITDVYQSPFQPLAARCGEIHLRGVTHLLLAWSLPASPGRIPSAVRLVAWRSDSSSICHSDR